MAEFEISLTKPYFKFNCSHFIAYRGYRERIHGHNYRISVKITGKDVLNSDGYLLDFKNVKKTVKSICEDLDEFFLVPTKSDVLRITESGSQILIECEDGSVFSLPKTDCRLLPLIHTSSEELSRYLWCRVVRDLGIETLRCAGVQKVELSLQETEGQAAVFRCELPDALLALESPNPSHMAIRGVHSFADLLEEGQRVITYGDDDTPYMPEPPEVIVSK